MTKILLVEDDASLCSILGKMLKFEGIGVIVADNGRTAKEILEAGQNLEIDAILCDIMMPEMDGYEFLSTVQKMGRFSTVPFLFMSACVSREEETKGIRLGARAFLRKPIDISEITATLRDVCGH
jgi:DNA-binding response OmpR family regulator